MKISSRLRVYLPEGSTTFGRPLYEAVVRRAREKGLAGATVFRGLKGYGRASADRLLQLSDDTPVVVEIVDDAAKLEALLPELAKLAPGRLVTLEDLKSGRLS